MGRVMLPHFSALSDQSLLMQQAQSHSEGNAAVGLLAWIKEVLTFSMLKYEPFLDVRMKCTFSFSPEKSALIRRSGGIVLIDVSARGVL